MSVTLRHIGIATDKINESIEFYSKFFNFTIVNDNHESGNFINTILGKKCEVRTVKMTNGDFMIEFLHFNSFQNSKFNIFTLGCTHFALTVSDVDNIFSRLSLENVEFISKPKLSDTKCAKVCFLKDPNNNIFIELVEEII